jgi:O-antigen/teichoic acid export membrane protein
MQLLLSSSALIFCGLMVRIGLLLVFEVLAARYLGPADYGLFSLAFTVIVVLSALPVLGLQNSLRRFISLYVEREKFNWVNGLTLLGVAWPIVWGVPIAALISASASPLSALVFHKSELGPVVAALAFVIPLWSLRRLATVIYSGFKRTMFKVVVEDIVEPILRVAAILLVALLGWGLTELAVGTMAAYGIVGLVALVLVELTRRSVAGPLIDWHVPTRELFSFSAPLVVSELAEVLLAWVSILMLGLLSIDFEVGLFRAISQPPMLASAILTSFAFIYLPIATELFASNDRYGWQSTNNAIVRWTMSLAFPIGIVCIAVPNDVISFLFGSAFTSGARAMQLLAAAYLVHASCGFTGLNLIVSGRTGIQMTGALAGLAANVLLCILWIPEYGASGAAAAVLVSVIGRNAYNLFFMQKLLKILPFDRRYGMILGVQLMTAMLLTIGVRRLEFHGLPAIAFVGLLQLPTALLVGWYARIYTSSDIEWFRGIVRRLAKSNVR